MQHNPIVNLALCLDATFRATLRGPSPDDLRQAVLQAHQGQQIVFPLGSESLEIFDKTPTIPESCPPSLAGEKP